MLLYRIASLLIRLLEAYELLIVANAVLSWIPTSPGSVIYDAKRALSTLTDPFVDIFRRMLPSGAVGGMGVDFSPIVALLALQLIERLIVIIL